MVKAGQASGVYMPEEIFDYMMKHDNVRFIKDKMKE